MKKLFLSIMLCASFGLLDAAHVPAAGPLTLGDAGAHFHFARGAIMKAVIDNDPANPGSNPKLAAANIALSTFDGRGQNFRSYQDIMHNIAQSINPQAALDAAQAIETVIMHFYDYDTYFVGGYKPTLSIFASGVRYWNIFSDDAKAKQLINELDKLADIVAVHSFASSTRLKMIVHSYRHWRRNLILSCVAYLGADAYRNRHDLKNSIVCLFNQRGLKNSDEIAINHAMNLKSGVLNMGKGIGIAAHGMWDYLIKPAGKYVVGGAEAFNNQKIEAKKAELATKNPGAIMRMRKYIFGSDVKQEVPVLTPRQKVWKDAIALEIDSRKERKEIWNQRLAKMRQFWNASPQTPADVKKKNNIVMESQSLSDRQKFKQRLSGLTDFVTGKQPQAEIEFQQKKKQYFKEKKDAAKSYIKAIPGNIVAYIQACDDYTPEDENKENIAKSKLNKTNKLVWTMPSPENGWPF